MNDVLVVCRDMGSVSVSPDRVAIDLRGSQFCGGDAVYGSQRGNHQERLERDHCCDSSYLRSRHCNFRLEKVCRKKDFRFMFADSLRRPHPKSKRAFTL